MSMVMMTFVGCEYQTISDVRRYMINVGREVGK